MDTRAWTQKPAAQVMLRWHLQEGRSAIPKPVKPARIAENFDVFSFELTHEQVAAFDALDTGVRRGPEPDSITLDNYGIPIPEAWCARHIDRDDCTDLYAPIALHQGEIVYVIETQKHHRSPPLPAVRRSRGTWTTVFIAMQL